MTGAAAVADTTGIPPLGLAWSADKSPPRPVPVW
jgi:hypothetical protein